MYRVLIFPTLQEEHLLARLLRRNNIGMEHGTTVICLDGATVTDQNRRQLPRPSSRCHHYGSPLRFAGAGFFVISAGPKEKQIKSCEHEHYPDICNQRTPEPTPEEQEINADNGRDYHQYVERGRYMPAHVASLQVRHITTTSSVIGGSYSPISGLASQLQRGWLPAFQAVAFGLRPHMARSCLRIILMATDICSLSVLIISE
jgi:hypothetical protein